jgi:hypothetical protein
MDAFIGALGRLFGSEGFVPQQSWGLWLVWEHVGGNALVWLPMTFLFAFASDRLDEESA